MSSPASSFPARAPGTPTARLWLALGLFAAAQILFFVPYATLAALAAAGAAAWLAWRAGLAAGAEPPEPEALGAELLPRGAPLVLLGLIVALAAFFRLWHLTSVPPGLYVDEVLTARNAFAWRFDHGAWYGSRPLVAAGWVETSNLYLAYASTVLRAFGDGWLGVRMISVLPSLAMVPLTYLLGALFGGRRAGLLAAFFLACSHWAARTGRTGWDEVLMSALALAVMLVLLLAVRHGRTWLALLAGLLLGLCLHTYLASRLVALQVVVWLGWESWSGERRRRTALTAAICLAVAALVAAPYFWHLATETAGGPDVRVHELSLARAGSAGQVARVLATNVVAHLLMFNANGANYIRDDLPRFPMLDPVTGTLFLAGLVVAFGLPGWRRRALAAWVGIQLLGGVLSHSGEGPPYAYRVASVAPWACLVAALGAVALWRSLIPALGSRARRVAVASAFVILVAAGTVDAWVLFVRGPENRALELAYGTVEARAGDWLAHHREGRPAYVMQGIFWSLRPYRHGLFYEQINGRNFYRRGISIAAVQIVAGLYRTDPERALDPIARGGDIDLVEAPPPAVRGPSVILLPRGEVEDVRGRYRIVRREDVTDAAGRPLFTALEVEPRRSNSPARLSTVKGTKAPRP